MQISESQFALLHTYNQCDSGRHLGEWGGGGGGGDILVSMLHKLLTKLATIAQNQ